MSFTTFVNAQVALINTDTKTSQKPIKTKKKKKQYSDCKLLFTQNTITDSLYFSNTCPMNNDVILTIFNTENKIVLTTNPIFNPKKNTCITDISWLEKGIYKLRLSDGDKSVTAQITKN